MNLKAYHRIYFIGIGGIGMSAIARYLLSLGKNVFGYDKTRTHLTDALENEGASITYEDEINLLPRDIDLVIFTPAIPSDHKQYNFYVNSEIPVIKRSEALGWISRMSKTIAVAGTHGKTTTSALVTQLLKNGDVSFSSFLGGISYGIGSNYLNRGSEWVVVEADEYDRSFLHLKPDVSILLSMDPDHLDIYGNPEYMKEGFWKFISCLKRGGTLYYRAGLEKNFPADWQKILVENEITHMSFGLEAGEIQARNIRVEDGKFVFDMVSSELSLIGVQSGLPGRHNIENAIAALAVGMNLNLESIQMVESISSFPGIYRRFERLFEIKNLIYIDDYAHHPTELNAAIDAARELFPASRIYGIFQPHLYSRTKDFSEGFAKALDKLDELIMMHIYPAREKPIPGVDSQLILSKMKLTKKQLINDQRKIIQKLTGIENGVILTLGAGDIDLLRDPIVKMLKKHG